MEWGKPLFVLVIIAICTAGWLINNWIRAKHGYALEDEWGGKTERSDHAVAATLKQENEALKQRIEALEMRAAALETIVTESGYQTAARIEALRDPVLARSPRQLDTTI